MKKGVQKIQSMDADMWAIAWQDFCQEQPEKPLPAPGLPDSLTLLGMAVKDAFHLLEGDANMILKGYKPDIDAPSLIHVTVMNGGTAFIVGSFLLRLVRKFTTMAQFRKIETEGDMIWRNLDARQQKQLEAGESKTMYAWVIENKEVLHPPMTLKTEPWIVPAIFSILWLDFLKGVLCDGFHVGPLFDYSWGTISVSVTTTKYNIFLFYGILSMSYCNLKHGLVPNIVPATLAHDCKDRRNLPKICYIERDEILNDGQLRGNQPYACARAYTYA